MLSLAVLPFYLAINIYIIRRFFCWLESCHRIFRIKRLKISLGIVYTLLAFTLAIAFFMPPASEPRRIVQLISNYWLGVFLYTVLTVLLGHLLSVLLRRVFRVLDIDFFKRRRNHIISGILTLSVIAGVSTYGIYHAQDIKLNEYSVDIAKEVNGTKSLKVVLIADLHLGFSIGEKHIRKTVDMINAQNPDIVCIAGDIYDNDFNAVKNPDKIAETLSEIKSTYGTYACWGNHDVDEKILAGFTFGVRGAKSHNANMPEFFRKANITLLEDETRLIDNKFYVSGRIDEKKPATPNNERKTPYELLSELDKTKPVIVIYHEPDELKELSDAGCDLLLCGHTHNGQLFPGNLTIKLFWENAAGYLKKGNMHNIVTSGVGVWGPFMRVGTDAEVVSVNVSFK